MSPSRITRLISLKIEHKVERYLKNLEFEDRQVFANLGMTYEYFNGTKVSTYPASAEAVRGPERVICVFYDEAAFAQQLDDSKVYDALKPNLANTNGDFIIVSTPNGRRGIFYDLWESGEFFKLEIPYTRAQGDLLSKEFINKEKKDTRIDFEQEYNCKFTTIRNAAIIE